MQHCLSVFLLLIIITTISSAQQDPPFLFKQDKSFKLIISSNKALSLAYNASKGHSLEVATVSLEMRGKTIVISTPVINKGENNSFDIATFSFPLFDATLEGHLEWGKAVLEQLESQQPDSTLLVNASLAYGADSILVGKLPISFFGGWKVEDEFWNRAAQYKLLQQQIWANDSVRFWKKEILRAEALLQLNKKAFDAGKASIKNIKAKLLQSCQDTALIDSLVQIEEALSKGLEKARNGQAITNPEKMQLAEQTTTRSQLLLAINKNKNIVCKEELKNLLEQRHLLNNIKRQQKRLELQLKQQQKQLKAFQDFYESTSQQLAMIVARLPK